MAEERGPKAENLLSRPSPPTTSSSGSSMRGLS